MSHPSVDIAGARFAFLMRCANGGGVLLRVVVTIAALQPDDGLSVRFTDGYRRCAGLRFHLGAIPFVTEINASSVHRACVAGLSDSADEHLP